ncbi:amidohydrolase family protein [Hufsiella ginkgonis]|uniref:Amidohydrolase family protein n=1 Tax=Hufsiella ginkgonis TaxID=2695274 RepID=A0A7K1Y0K6_9SPHI|nr:amidohydrolase family protein [Hufsiella ginkgonis]MXV16763.1 amidohydrolase family protein [Hufsiella ginkgonis]
MQKIFITCTVLFMAVSAYAQPAKKKYSLVVTNANIVDVAAGKILYKKLLAISGDTIKVVADTKTAASYRADRYIDAAGKYVMPGLWDMHIHFRGGPATVTANKAFLPLFLAYGVTTVRECGGDITPQVLDWRKRISQGELAGPRIFTSGPKLDGPQSTWAGSIEVETPAQVAAALDSLQRIPSDFVKIYDSKISAGAYLEIIAQAKKRNLKVSGHMPFTVKLTEAADLGMDGSEHLYYIFKACSAKEDSITALIREREHTTRPIGLFAALPSLVETFSQDKADQLFKYLARKQFTVTPTLFISKTLAGIKDTDHNKDSLLKYIDPVIRETYQGRVNSAKRQTAEATTFTKKFNEACTALVPQMYAAGVNIVAGSDCGASNSFVYPGQSIHEEIKLLVKAGLTPREALTTATINGAKFFGVSRFYGSLKAGKCADMIMLTANPLQDISAIDHLSSVIANGKVYHKPELDAMAAYLKSTP